VIGHAGFIDPDGLWVAELEDDLTVEAGFGYAAGLVAPAAFMVGVAAGIADEEGFLVALVEDREAMASGEVVAPAIDYLAGAVEDQHIIGRVIAQEVEPPVFTGDHFVAIDERMGSLTYD